MRPVALALLASAALLVAAAPASALPRLHAIVADDAPAYLATVGAVRTALDGLATLSDGDLGTPVPDDAVAVVTVGAAAAAHYVATGDERPLFATLVPAAGWRAIVAADDAAPPRTAIWLDQPLDRQLAFIRVLLPSLREIGVVIGPDSVALRDELHAAAADRQVLVNEWVATGGTINGPVMELLRRSEILLALPDSAVFNRYNVQSVLVASFRARRPVIGFSESWVRAGALAAVFTTPEQLGEDLGETIASWLEARGELPPSRAPSRWSIAVNRRVAFSLDLALLPDAVVEQRLRAALGERR